MTDYHHTATIDMPATDLFAYLRKPGNLPRYFPQIKQVEPQGGDIVRVAADVDGERVESEAWFNVDEKTLSLSWGSQGPHDYHGRLSIEDTGPNETRLTITLSSVRQSANDDVQRGLEETVAALAHTAVAESDVEAAEDQGGWAGN